MSVDSKIPSACAIRSRILSFASPSTIRLASQMTNDWREAASTNQAWEPKFKTNGVLSHCERFDLPSPLMYELIYQQDFSTILPFLTSAVDDFIPALGTLTGTATNESIYRVQWPALLTLVRRMEVVSLAAATVPVKEGYTTFKPFVMLIASVVRWYKVKGCPQEMIPWLIALYRWASTTTQAYFHKIMLAPAMALIDRTSGLVSAQGILKAEDDPAMPWQELVDLTVELGLRFLKLSFPTSLCQEGDEVPPGSPIVEDESFASMDSAVGPEDGTDEVMSVLLRRASRRAKKGGKPLQTDARLEAARKLGLTNGQESRAPKPKNIISDDEVCQLVANIKVKDMTCSSLKLLTDDDPRLIIGILYHIVRKNPAMYSEVTRQLIENWGTLGLEEYVAASRRVEYLFAVQTELTSATTKHVVKQ